MDLSVTVLSESRGLAEELDMQSNRNTTVTSLAVSINRIITNLSIQLTYVMPGWQS